MSRNVQILLSVAVLAGIAVLVTVGLRVAPLDQAANSAESRQGCKVQAPEALRASAQEWCDNGLFANISVTEQRDNVITAAQFNTNGSHMWQMQSSNLLGSFKALTEKMAANAKGKSVAISIQDGADERIAVCARFATDGAAKCEAK